MGRVMKRVEFLAQERVYSTAATILSAVSNVVRRPKQDGSDQGDIGDPTRSGLR